jgi:hypothetical protein
VLIIIFLILFINFEIIFINSGDNFYLSSSTTIVENQNSTDKEENSIKIYNKTLNEIVENNNLLLETKYIKDDFQDFSKIDFKRNVELDLYNDEVRLKKYITFSKLINDSRDESPYYIQQTSDKGYFIVGTIWHDNNQSSDIWSIKTDEQGNIIWNRSLSRNVQDYGYSGRQTIDGGYIIVGKTRNEINSSFDILLVKITENGTMEWNLTFGDENNESGNYIEQTKDGGYIIIGSTISSFNRIGNIWLIKTDQIGNLEWDRTFNRSNMDIGISLKQTSDNGYILLGRTDENESEINFQNAWFIKIDNDGNILWNITLNKDNNSNLIINSIQITKNNNYIITGSIENIYGDKCQIYLAKIEKSGIVQWEKIYKGYDATGYCVQPTIDKGYIIVGTTYSKAWDNYNIILLKTDRNGLIQWRKDFDKGNYDCGRYIQQTSDDGYILTGETYSFNGKTSDVWIIKTDNEGNISINITLPIKGWGLSIQQTNDGNYIISGGHNVRNSHFSYSEMLLIKINSAGNIVWDKNYRGLGWGWDVQQTNDDGYIVCGGYPSINLLKFNKYGKLEWEKHFRKGEWDEPFSVRQTYDGGYIIVGATLNREDRNGDVLLIKTDEKGNMEWNKTFYQIGCDEWGYSIFQTKDEGYIFSSSKTSMSITGFNQLWLFKIDKFGNEQWIKKFENVFGFEDEGPGITIQPTNDDGFIIIGTCDQDLLEENENPYLDFSKMPNLDIWMAKINKSGEAQWIRTFGGKGWEEGVKAIQTPDKGYVVFSNILYKDKTRDIWLIKTDELGNMVWNKTFGGNTSDRCNNGLVTNNGEYIIIGSTGFSFKIYNSTPNFLLIKTDKDGNIQPTGELKSKNLFESKIIYWITSFGCNLDIPKGTNIYVQFSKNNLTWVNSKGELNKWDNLYNGTNKIDLINLAWDKSNFYYKMILSSDIYDVPTIKNINISYLTYNFLNITDHSNYNPDFDYDNIPNSDDLDDDNDYITDEFEVRFELNPLNPDDANQDYDNDGLTNFEESLYITHPFKEDTDSDGFTDNQEIIKGTDPLDEKDYPQKDKPESGTLFNVENYAYFIIAGILIIIVLIILGLIINNKMRKNEDKKLKGSKNENKDKQPQLQVSKIPETSPQEQIAIVTPNKPTQENKQLEPGEDMNGTEESIDKTTNDKDAE